MKRSTLGALVGLGLALSSCTSPAYENNHWHITNIAPRVGYHFFGYRSSVDGSYFSKLGRDGGSVGLTVRRHFVGDNPNNPLLPQPTPAPYRPHPPQVEFKVGE
jgi:hypothetical protein